MEEDPRTTSANDGMHVVLDHCQMRVGARRRPHIRRRHPERRTSAATDALERVVRRRLRVLDPPVPAAEANVAKRDARIRRVAVHRPADRKETSRCRAVALPSARTHAVLADPSRVWAARREPATIFPAHPGSRRRIRRPCGRGATVINCREAAPAGVARSFARFAGHVATAMVASWTARSIEARYRPLARRRVRSNG